MNGLVRDFRLAFRALRSTPAFALGSLAVIAVGTASTAIVFSVVDALMLRPLPVEDPARLVRIWKHDRERGFEHFPLTYPEYSAWAERSHAFSGMAALYAHGPWDAVLHGDNDDGPSDVRLNVVSTNFFQVLGVRAALGRFLTSEDARDTTLPPVVLSHGLWRRAFGADPSVVGTSIPLSLGDHHAFHVVGVTPEAFTLGSGADAWTPILAVRPQWELERGCECDVIARLEKGVSLDSARGELLSVHAGLVRDLPEKYRPMEIVATPLRQTIAGRTGGVALLFLAAVSLLVLLSIFNLAGLFSSRLGSRAPETAVLSALGASPLRLARRFLAESVLIAVGGFGLGLYLADIGLNIVLALKGDELPLADRIVINSRTLAAAAAVVSLICAGFGALPALRVGNPRTFQALRGRTPGLERRFQGPLMVAQFSLSLVLLVGAGLLVRTLIAQESIDRGVIAENLLNAELRLARSRFEAPESLMLDYRRVLTALESRPEVRSAATMLTRPGWGESGFLAPFVFQGQNPEEADDNPYSAFESVSENYFATMGIPVLRGRAFTGADRLDSRRVVVVSQMVAERYWPGEDPLGKTVTLGDVSSTVVGVTANTRYNELKKSWQNVYFPMQQNPFSDVREFHHMLVPNYVVVRTSLDREHGARLISVVIRETDPTLGLKQVERMTGLMAQELRTPRFNALVAALFGAFALLLSTVGLYASLSTFVSERRGEVGIRMSLGASPERIRDWVLGRAAKLAASGMVLGALLALPAGELAARFLFEVSPRDPVTFLAVLTIVAAVTFVAAWVPARRASRSDPMTLLRQE